MRKRSRLLNLGKNILVGAGLVSTLLYGGKEARAQNQFSKPDYYFTESKLEERISDGELEKFSPRIELDFRDPRIDAESNTKMKQSAVNLFGEAVESSEKKMENSLEQPYLEKISKLAELGLYSLASVYSEVISHEYGHYRVAEKQGVEGIKVHIGFPMLDRSFCRYGKLNNNNSLDDKLERTEGGPNQDSMNILSSFINSQVTKDKLYTIVDRIITNLGQNIYLQKSKGGIDDYKKIEELLNEKGYKISLNEMIKNNTTLNFLNPTNWNDFYSLWEFFTNGKRDVEHIKIGQGNLKFGLPNLSHFFTIDGELATLTEFAEYKKTPIEISFSHDLDFTQEKAGVDTIRAGGKVHGIALTKRMNFSPYLNLDFVRSSLDYKGFNIGTEIGIKISKNFSLTGKLEYNKEDILESDIKGKGNGIYATAGFKFAY